MGFWQTLRSRRAGDWPPGGAGRAATQEWTSRSSALVTDWAGLECCSTRTSAAGACVGSADSAAAANEALHVAGPRAGEGEGQGRKAQAKAKARPRRPAARQPPAAGSGHARSCLGGRRSCGPAQRSVAGTVGGGLAGVLAGCGVNRVIRGHWSAVQSIPGLGWRMTWARVRARATSAQEPFHQDIRTTHHAPRNLQPSTTARPPRQQTRSPPTTLSSTASDLSTTAVHRRRLAGPRSS